MKAMELQRDQNKLHNHRRREITKPQRICRQFSIASSRSCGRLSLFKFLMSLLKAARDFPLTFLTSFIFGGALDRCRNFLTDFDSCMIMFLGLVGKIIYVGKKPHKSVVSCWSSFTISTDLVINFLLEDTKDYCFKSGQFPVFLKQEKYDDNCLKFGFRFFMNPWSLFHLTLNLNYMQMHYFSQLDQGIDTKHSHAVILRKVKNISYKIR